MTWCLHMIKGLLVHFFIFYSAKWFSMSWKKFSPLFDSVGLFHLVSGFYFVRFKLSFCFFMSLSKFLFPLSLLGSSKPPMLTWAMLESIHSAPHQSHLLWVSRRLFIDWDCKYISPLNRWFRWVASKIKDL